MIRVNVLTNNKQEIIGLEAKGHANSGPYGNDLICAGVSSIITGGFNNIKKEELFEITLSKGYAKIKLVAEKIGRHDQIVIETMITQLETIQESNPDYVKVEYTCIS